MQVRALSALQFIRQQYTCRFLNAFANPSTRLFSSKFALFFRSSQVIDKSHKTKVGMVHAPFRFFLFLSIITFSPFSHCYELMPYISRKHTKARTALFKQLPLKGILFYFSSMTQLSPMRTTLFQ